jgi:hypothetical protein
MDVTLSSSSGGGSPRTSRVDGPFIRLLADHDYVPRQRGPKIYVYELPGEYNMYGNLNRLDRPLYLLFWQRLLSAGVRTTNGDEVRGLRARARAVVARLCARVPWPPHCRRHVGAAAPVAGGGRRCAHWQCECTCGRNTSAALALPARYPRPSHGMSLTPCCGALPCCCLHGSQADYFYIPVKARIGGGDSMSLISAIAFIRHVLYWPVCAAVAMPCRMSAVPLFGRGLRLGLIAIRLRPAFCWWYWWPPTHCGLSCEPGWRGVGFA